MTSYIRSRSWLIVAILIGILQRQQVDAVGGFAGSEQSFFFGTRANAAVICFQQQIYKGTALPTTITYTGAVTVKFITAFADKYSRIGFQANMKNAALPQATATLQIDGPNILPYNVLVQMWC